MAKSAVFFLRNYVNWLQNAGYLLIHQWINKLKQKSKIALHAAPVRKQSPQIGIVSFFFKNIYHQSKIHNNNNNNHVKILHIGALCIACFPRHETHWYKSALPDFYNYTNLKNVLAILLYLTHRTETLTLPAHYNALIGKLHCIAISSLQHVIEAEQKI